MFTIGIIVVSTILAMLLYSWFSRKPKPESRGGLEARKMVSKTWDHERLKAMIQEHDFKLPAMFVDLDAFDANVHTLVSMVEGTGKTLRMATKSIRCPYLIHRISELGRDVTRGFMCFSMDEIALLADQGLDDFYLAYPTFQKTDLRTALQLTQKGHKITLTVDCVKHVQFLDDAIGHMVDKRGQRAKIRVCIDLDLSFKLFAGAIHLGAHRSKLSSADQFKVVAEAISTSRHVVLAGVMGYEAHVAGLPDNNVLSSAFGNSVVQFVKEKFFYKEVMRIRKEISDYCEKNNIILDFFNGGGTGNLKDVARDPAVTEVTAGSGFLQAQLFDYYHDNKCTPAMSFALQATRVNDDYIVCQSGGFIASGNIAEDKFPTPFQNPLRLRHFDSEGYGEVQTPLKVLDQHDTMTGKINVADPVFFRSAKSGEIAEHFNEYILIRNCEVVDTVKTYRGLGQAFH